MAPAPLLDVAISGRADFVSSSEAEAPHRAGPRGRWLVLADRGGTADRLAAALRARGHTCTVIDTVVAPRSPSEHARAVHDFLAGRPAPVRGVLDLRPLDLVIDEASTALELESDQRQVVGGVLCLAQALAGLSEPEPPRLMLVTRRSQAVGFDFSDLALAQTTAWSTVRVAGREDRELRPLLLDLDGSGPERETEFMLAELLHNDGENEIVDRGSRRMVRRLVRRKAGSSRRLSLPEERPGEVVIAGTAFAPARG